MKKILMFMFPTCPYCRRALEYQKSLLERHPEYAAIPFQMVDEQKEPALAEQYDYYYVPTYFVGDEKICEGVLTAADVEKVFRLAAAD